ncbi:MAG: hypothetical protein U0M06_07435 [Clostridia bacterium]|nr:hypothetical protein [Clostridia bacterium]
MYSYSYNPPRDLKKCSTFPFAGSLVGFGFMYISTFMPYPFLFQALGFAALSIAILMTVRYLVRRYVYSIQKSGDNDYDFTVHEISGKTSKAVCRISMDEISDFIYSHDGKIPLPYRGKNGRDILRFDYCQDFMPKNAYYLYANLKEGKVCIKFSPDSKLAEIIESLRPKEYDFKKSE